MKNINLEVNKSYQFENGQEYRCVENCGDFRSFVESALQKGEFHEVKGTLQLDSGKIDCRKMFPVPESHITLYRETKTAGKKVANELINYGVEKKLIEKEGSEKLLKNVFEPKISKGYHDSIVKDYFSISSDQNWNDVYSRLGTLKEDIDKHKELQKKEKISRTSLLSPEEAWQVTMDDVKETIYKYERTYVNVPYKNAPMVVLGENKKDLIARFESTSDEILCQWADEIDRRIGGQKIVNVQQKQRQTLAHKMETAKAGAQKKLIEEILSINEDIKALQQAATDGLLSGKSASDMLPILAKAEIKNSEMKVKINQLNKLEKQPHTLAHKMEAAKATAQKRNAEKTAQSIKHPPTKSAPPL